jgi:hypothetical protein
MMQAQSTSTTCGLKINEVMYQNQQHKAAEMFSGSENEAVDHTLNSWHPGAFSLRLVHFVDTYNHHCAAYAHTLLHFRFTTRPTAQPPPFFRLVACYALLKVASIALMEELHTDSIDGGHEASYGLGHVPGRGRTPTVIE